MRIQRRHLLLAALAALATLALPTRAEQKVQDGPWQVHYAAIPSNSLDADVARRFGVSRSRYRSLLVLNAQKDLGEGRLPLSVPASGKGEVSSLIGHRQVLALRAIRDGEVHYLIGEFEALDQQVMRFAVEVTPEGAERPLRVEFHQQFFND